MTCSAGITSTAAGIAFRCVHLALGGRPIFAGLDLALPERRIAIIGGNGSGKTTLARLALGLVAPDAGEVTVDGLDVSREGAAVRRRAGLVFQNAEHQIIMPTVAEEVAFGLENQRLPRAEVARRTAAALAEHELAHLAEASAHLLSGGEQKRLMLAAVLVMRPALIILDEPLSGLDRASRRRIAALLDALPQRLVTITHDLPSIAHYDRAIWLDNGRIRADGTPDGVIEAYEQAA